MIAITIVVALCERLEEHHFLQSVSIQIAGARYKATALLQA